jgi:hypothetical protein
MTSLKMLLFVIPVLLILQSSRCKVSYNQSGKGGRTIPDSASVAVMQFTNSAPLAKPTLTQTLTESLRDFIQRQTRFAMVTEDADLTFEGEIVGYAVTPVSIVAGATDQAAVNRLTITIKVKYTDEIDERYNFESNFSRFADFPSTQDLSAVEDALIKEISDQLTQDIINKSIFAW